MEDALNRFDKRAAAVRRRHHRLAQGYVMRMDTNGVIRCEPDRKACGVVLHGLALLIVAVFALKGILLASLGPEEYAAKHAGLAQGEPLDRAGAVLMQVDPVTKAVAAALAPVFR